MLQKSVALRDMQQIGNYETLTDLIGEGSLISTTKNNIT